MSLDLQVTDLAPIVARSLGKPSLEIVEWDCQPLAVGGSQVVGGLGIYRVAGVARHDASLVHWSLIVKVSKGGAERASDDPGAWNYWKREVLAYQSGLLDLLPGGIVAPRCYALQEQPNGECWLWRAIWVSLMALILPDIPHRRPSRGCCRDAPGNGSSWSAHSLNAAWGVSIRRWPAVGLGVMA